MLFATLDPTMRAIDAAARRARSILSDTVGFISDLPTTLVAAFRATLEEVVEADLILHVRDIAACATARRRRATSQTVLDELGIDAEGAARGVIEVWNKIDLLGRAKAASRSQNHRGSARRDGRRPIAGLGADRRGARDPARGDRGALAGSPVGARPQPSTPPTARRSAWLHRNAEVLGRGPRPPADGLPSTVQVDPGQCAARDRATKSARAMVEQGTGISTRGGARSGGPDVCGDRFSAALAAPRARPSRPASPRAGVLPRAASAVLDRRRSGARTWRWWRAAGLVGVDLEVARQIDHREQQVADLAGGLGTARRRRARPRSRRSPRGSWRAPRADRSSRSRPWTPSACSFSARISAGRPAGTPSSAPRHSGVDARAAGSALGLLLGLDLVPQAFGRPGVSSPASPKTCGWRRISLSVIACDHVAEVEGAWLLRHAGVKDDLQQEVAELVAQVVEIAARDGVGDLVGFLDRVGRDGREILLEVPRAAGSGRAQRRHDLDQPWICRVTGSSMRAPCDRQRQAGTASGAASAIRRCARRASADSHKIYYGTFSDVADVVCGSRRSCGRSYQAAQLRPYCVKLWRMLDRACRHRPARRSPAALARNAS